MHKTAITYGLISGIILGSSFFILRLLIEPEVTGTTQLIGFTIMFACLSLIFFGVRAYRNKVLGGAISIKSAFLCGLYISAIASVLYAIGWVLYFNTVGDGGMMDIYFQDQIQQINAAADAPDAAARQIAGVEKMREQYYSNNLYVFGLTLLEIFPIALVITIITSLILRRKRRYVI